LEKLGASITRGEGVISLDTRTFASCEFDRVLAKRMRASVVLTGPILARFGEVSFPYPGGCVIGTRPVDLFIEGYQKMGASVKEEDERFIITAKDGTLKGAEIFFRVQSVTATETFMMTATLAQGTTVLKNCAMEPEIAHLAQFLNDSGATITGAGTSTITIIGGQKLKANKPYETMPDRIEAGSFILLSALAASDVTVKGCDPKHIESLIESLRYVGVPLEVGENFVRITAPKKGTTFKPLSIRTHEYPGFPTDLQAPMTIFLTQSEGESTLFETIFEGRLSYTEDLVRMGADIKMYDSQHAIIKGPTPLRGKELEGPDLRAGLAYVIAGIIAEGETRVANAYNIDRGYERIEERLCALGVPITRVMEVCEPAE
jgi:UDP-N-acetylglucosamine 1-carboxyvinyltransferase